MINRPLTSPSRSYPDWTRPMHVTARSRARRASSVGVGRPVAAPHVTERVADLAHGRAGAERLAEWVEQISGALRGMPDVIDPALDLRAVPGGPQPGEALSLLLLDGRVDAQRLVGLVAAVTEPVHADDHAVPRVDLARDVIGRSLDLGLLEAPLDRGDRAAEILHPRQQFAGRLLDVAGHRLHRIRPGERVNGDRKSTRLNSSHVEISYAV